MFYKLFDEDFQSQNNSQYYNKVPQLDKNLPFPFQSEEKISQHFIEEYQDNGNESFEICSLHEQESLIDEVDEKERTQTLSLINSDIVPETKKTKKNSKIIKKLGRMRIKTKKRLKAKEQRNYKIEKMMNLLEVKVIQSCATNMIDSFTTRNFNVLLSHSSEKIISDNINATQDKLNKYLRKYVLSSSQTKGQSKQQCLNIFKCFSLRKILNHSRLIQ